MLARNVSAEGRSRAFVGGASVPVTALAEVAEPLVAVHGQSDQHRLLQARAQREALDRFGGPAAGRAAGDVRRPAPPARGHRGRARRGGRHRPRAGPGGRPAALRARRDRGRRRPSRARTPRWRPRRPGWASPTPCAPPPSRPARRSRARTATPTPSPRRPPPGPLLDGVREHDAEAGELADRLAELTYLLSDLAADVASYAARIDTDPARLAAVSERRAALTALTRKYGDTIDEVLAWAERSATRLLDLDDTDERIEELRAEQEVLRPRSPGRPRRRCRRRGPRRPRGSASRSPPSSRCSRCRTPASTVDGATAADRFTASGRRRGRADAGRQHRLRAAPAQQGRVRR